MKKGIMLLAGICLLAIITAGCGSAKPTTESTNTVQPAQPAEKLQAQVEVINTDIPATPQE